MKQEKLEQTHILFCKNRFIHIFSDPVIITSDGRYKKLIKPLVSAFW